MKAFLRPPAIFKHAIVNTNCITGVRNGKGNVLREINYPVPLQLLVKCRVSKILQMKPQTGSLVQALILLSTQGYYLLIETMRTLETIQGS